MVVMGQVAAELSSTTDADAMRAAGRHAGAALRSRSGSSSQRRSILTRTVELDVIPRLLRLHRGAGALAAVPSMRADEQVSMSRPVTAGEVAALTTLSLSSSEPAMSEFVAAMQAQGFGAEALNLELLAPSALRLGELWEDDQCDFTQVTIGLWRLQSVMRQIAPAWAASSGPVRSSGRIVPRALLVPLPGEQHTFGLAMVVDFFRRAGWNAWSGPVQSRGELATMVRSEWVDVVGFSLACDERLETARTEIQAVRIASRNPGLAVMVGGPPFVADPGLARAIGADGTAGDAMAAVAEATSLLQRQAERR